MGQHQGFAEVIKARLDDAGISQRQAALATGIPLTTLNRRLTGGSPFLVTELASFASMFDVPVSRLAFEAEEAERPAS